MYHYIQFKCVEEYFLTIHDVITLDHHWKMDTALEKTFLQSCLLVNKSILILCTNTAIDTKHMYLVIQEDAFIK